MTFYTKQHRYYCGVDLHARSMYVCVLDQAGETAVHRKIPSKPEPLLRLLKPYRHDVAVAVECMFCWYWVADLCAEEGLPFILGHVFYMKAIHGGKTKNDRIDSYKIAALLRGGNLPIAYVYPREMRATRDLLRRRMRFVRKRGGLFSHIQNTITQYNLPPYEERIDQARNRAGLLEHCEDEDVQMSVAANMAALPRESGQGPRRRRCAPRQATRDTTTDEGGEIATDPWPQTRQPDDLTGHPLSLRNQEPRPGTGPTPLAPPPSPSITDPRQRGISLHRGDRPFEWDGMRAQNCF